jgi:hypothetical protein
MKRRSQLVGRPVHCPYQPGGEIMGKHICTSWQGFLQQLITLISHGYRYYCKIEYPMQKQDKWYAIDTKLIAKYDADISKDKRYRNQLKEQANYMFIRWENYALVLRSAGVFMESDDRFVDIKEKPLVLDVGATLRLKIVPVGSKGHVTAYIEKSVYREIKAELLDHCRHKRVDVLKGRFSALNGIPAYSGIVQQKAALLTEVVIEGRRHGLKLLRKDFIFRTGRKIVKVFD